MRVPPFALPPARERVREGAVVVLRFAIALAPAPALAREVVVGLALVGALVFVLVALVASRFPSCDPEW